MAKDPLNRTKVVVRHLPPTLSKSAFFEQIDQHFTGRYNWSSFFEGSVSTKRQNHARAYINFNSPDDVFAFAEFFNGHVFVNEKGAQYKAMVEYAPSQRVPKPDAKPDAREGTIFKDPEYLAFLEQISNPPENLPSADVQLERREAELAGVREAPIVTPLMEFIRRKRAGKSANQAASNVKISGRASTSSPRKSRSSATKPTPEKKKYIVKTGGKSKPGKDKSPHISVPRGDDRQNAPTGERLAESLSGTSSTETGEKKILLLKGKEQDISGSKGVPSLGENSSVLPLSKSNTTYDASGRIIRGILLNKEAPQSQSTNIHSEQRLQSEKGKRPIRPASMRSSGSYAFNESSSLSPDPGWKRPADDKSAANNQNGIITTPEKQDRRTRNRERADHGVWTPLRRSDPSPVDHEHISQSSPTLPKSHEGSNSRQFLRRGPPHVKDSGFANEGKSSKRGASGAGHIPHEKQVWIQKSASGS